MIISIKFKVFERSTGNIHLEEWQILPRYWPYHFSNMLFIEEIYDKNFVFLRICEERDRTDIPDIYMILNLVTRKPYWIKEEVVEEKIFTYVNDNLGYDEEPYHLGTNMIGESEIVKMKVKPDEIQLMSFIQITHDGYHGHDDYLLIGTS